MNAQQARIEALLEEAADEVEEMGRPSLVIESALAAEGYLLCHLNRDTARIINNR